MKEVWVNQDLSNSWMSNQTKQLGERVLVRELTKTPKIPQTELHRSCVEMENASDQQPTCAASLHQTWALWQTGPERSRVDHRGQEWTNGNSSSVKKTQMKRLLRVIHNLGVLWLSFWEPCPAFHVSFLKNLPLVHSATNPVLVESCSKGCRSETFAADLEYTSDFKKKIGCGSHYGMPWHTL